MRLAIFSDIHGNLTALEAVLADMEQVGGIDLTWCLGDIAAFGPRPAECLRRVKALAEAGRRGVRFVELQGRGTPVRYELGLAYARRSPLVDAFVAAASAAAAGR